MNLTRWLAWGTTAAIAVLVLGDDALDSLSRAPKPRPAKTDEEIQLIVLAGQSNAQGIKSDASYYPHAPFTDQKVWFWWETFKNGHRISGSNAWGGMGRQGGHFERGHFGPEVSLSRAYADNGRRVAILKFVHPGSSLARDWRAGDPTGDFAKLEALLPLAIADLGKDGRVRPACFVWIQGETDALHSSRAAAYEHNLRRVIASARRFLGADVRIVLGAAEGYTEAHDARVIEAQERISREDRGVRRTSMRGLEMADHAHLTAKGTIEQGKRIYDACVGS